MVCPKVPGIGLCIFVLVTMLVDDILLQMLKEAESNTFHGWKTVEEANV